jgi:hypothetical protein
MNVWVIVLYSVSLLLWIVAVFAFVKALSARHDTLRASVELEKRLAGGGNE